MSNQTTLRRLCSLWWRAELAFAPWPMRLTGRHGEAAQLAAIEAMRELMADYPQRANRQPLGSFFLDVAYFPGLVVLLIYKCASV